MADFSSVINSIPPVTRSLLLGVAVITAPCLLGLVSPADVALIWWRVRKDWQVWRPATAFLFGGGGFPFLYDVFLIYRNSTALERDTYLNNTADYAWTHLMMGAFILNYLWCRANPTLKVSIFGLLTIPTSLYPPALIVLDVLTGGPSKALGGLIGLLAGHLWWFLSIYLPTYAPTHVRRPNPLASPERFKAFFSAMPSRASTATSWGGTRVGGSNRASAASTRTQSSQRPVTAADAVRHRWGGGQRLGGESL
ncbi:hypothetical protein JCM24511_05717 [Saitozyma sp. JCM 24511]|nr:hypothetical protein JCM24511_05717 [Saitozyma sp. JCM 24511]